MASSSIGVYARIKPDAAGAEPEGVSVVRDEAQQQRAILVRNLEFSMDWVFGRDATQADVYEVVGRERVARVVDGYNVCIVAYGQTGSGKTHTMFGPDEVLTDWRSSAEVHGLALRGISDLFAAVSSGRAGGVSYTVTCSYVEVYNDGCVCPFRILGWARPTDQPRPTHRAQSQRSQLGTRASRSVNDLLGRQKGLPLREARGGGVLVEGLVAEEVTSLDGAMEALQRGNDSRTTAQMAMNLRSSRSHAVFSLTLHGRGSEGDAASGKLFLVDLAGMESSKKSYAVEGASAAGARREEAKQINISLYALGSVIEKLSSKGAGHVPFRNSKLTRLLQECLQGNCAAAFVVTLRSEPQNLDESAATLRFAQRARAIPVVVRPNVRAAPADAGAMSRELKAVTRELSEARALIARLQSEARAASSAGGGAGSAEEGQLDELTNARLQMGQLSEQMTELVEVARETALAAAPPGRSESGQRDGVAFEGATVRGGGASVGRAGGRAGGSAGRGALVSSSGRGGARPGSAGARGSASSRAPAPAAGAPTTPTSAASEAARRRLEREQQRSQARLTPRGQQRPASGGGGAPARSGEEDPRLFAQLQRLAEFAGSQASSMQGELGELASQRGGAAQELPFAAAQQKMAVTVPRGASSGMMLQVYTPQGLMHVQIPQGVVAGSSFEFLMPNLGGAQGRAYPGQHTLGQQSLSSNAGAATPRTQERVALRASAMEAAAMDELGTLFPSLPPSELRAVLTRLQWDVNAAACELIDVGLAIG